MATDKRATNDPRIDQAAKLLSAYLKGGRQRTDLLRGLAEIVVDLRQTFTLKDGRSDLGGRSPEYRAAMREIYHRANVQEADRDAIQTALRYHVNNLLHELHDAEELTAAGLGERSAKERLAADREAAAALRSALKDPFLLSERILALAEHLEPTALAAQSSIHARASRQALEGAAERIAAGVAAINARYPKRGKRV